MTDLLTPEEAENGLALWDDYEGTGYQVSPEWVKRLCRDYLTLWDELSHERQISDDAMKELAFEKDRNSGLVTKLVGLEAYCDELCEELDHV